jgi:hypothetical protein
MFIGFRCRAFVLKHFFCAYDCAYQIKSQEVENKAKQLRATANDKKKVAKEAKDAACETRFGGKFLCIRPFGIGY